MQRKVLLLHLHLLFTHMYKMKAISGLPWRHGFASSIASVWGNHCPPYLFLLPPYLLFPPYLLLTDSI
jgi:hypothetical protein